MIRRLLKRWAWHLVREEVGAAILAAEQRQAATTDILTGAVEGVRGFTIAVRAEAMQQQRAIIVNVVQVLNDAGIRCHVETADSGVEVIPPGKLN